MALCALACGCETERMGLYMRHWRSWLECVYQACMSLHDFLDCMHGSVCCMSVIVSSLCMAKPLCSYKAPSPTCLSTLFCSDGRWGHVKSGMQLHTGIWLTVWQAIRRTHTQSTRLALLFSSHDLLHAWPHQWLWLGSRYYTAGNGGTFRGLCQHKKLYTKRCPTWCCWN